MTIEERVENLERTVNRTRFFNRLLAVFCFGLLLAMWFYTSGTPTAQQRVLDEVRAKKFVLVDENGKERVVLSIRERNSYFELFDDKSTIRARLSVNNIGGPDFTLFDKTGNERAKLYAPDGGAGLILSGEHGQGDIRMFVLLNGPEINLIDSNNKFRASFTVWDGNPGLYLYDKNEKIRAVLGAYQEEPENERTTTYPESSLHLFNPDGNVIWQAP